MYQQYVTLPTNVSTNNKISAKTFSNTTNPNSNISKVYCVNFKLNTFININSTKTSHSSTTIIKVLHTHASKTHAALCSYNTYVIITSAGKHKSTIINSIITGAGKYKYNKKLS